ncbi:hypothetical protein [Spirosoma oryzae]|nr:hypothetical protein [Spirosoma oryzae]
MDEYLDWLSRGERQREQTKTSFIQQEMTLEEQQVVASIFSHRDIDLQQLK